MAVPVEKEGVSLTEQQKKEKVASLRPIDDVFFEVLAKSVPVCQEVLRTIMEDDNLEVKSSVTQSDERNLYGRSVRLDALCELSDGTKVNIEVQRADNDNHLKRARFNASSITVRGTQTGINFDDVMELYIIYISEFDFFKENKTIYHVDKILRETETVVDDGLHEIFVNTAVNDGTDIAELMSCFLKKDINSEKFPILSNEVRRLKETEGGIQSMSDVMKKYEEIAVKEAMYAEHITQIKKMIQKGYTKEAILDLDFTEEEYAKAESELLLSV